MNNKSPLFRNPEQSNYSQKETHVLLDEDGSPVLRGTLEEMQESAAVCVSQGLTKVSIEPITSWDWTMVNWGD